MTIFFVLSGFLIGRILLRTFAHSEFGGRMLLNFWIRRWFRTLPAYFTVLIALVFLWHATGRALPENLYGYFVFSQNLASPHPVFFGEAWSLAVEEWFYLLVPIPLFLAAGSNAIDKKKLVLLLVAACIVVVAAFRAYRAHRFGYPDIGSWDENLRKQVITRFDSLMFGVLGAYLSLFARRCWRKSAYVALGVGLALLVADKVCSTDYDGKMLYINYAKLTTTSLGALLLLPFLSSMRATEGIFVRMVTLLSLISYSMYLLNFSLIRNFLLPAVTAYFSDGREPASAMVIIGQYAAFWILTISISYMLWRWVERPMTSLRDNFRVVTAGRGFGKSIEAKRLTVE